MAAGKALRWGMLASVARAVRSSSRPGAPGIGARLAALPRLLRATARGEYHGTTVARLMLIVGALAYVVSPVDFMPEALFTVFGLADDALVVAWIAMAVVNETEQFLEWERFGRTAAGQTVPGHTVPAQTMPGQTAYATESGSWPGGYPQDTVR